MPLVRCPVCASLDIEVVESLHDGRRRVRCEDCQQEWTHGVALPDPAIGRQLAVFRNDDTGYMNWIATWPDGYVLNCERNPRSSYLVLHRANCPSITTLQPGMNTFTGDYIKVCSTDRQLVRQWARAHGGADPTWCDLCL